MGVGGSPFCEHKKLRTGCAACRPSALPTDGGLKATPFVTQEEREEVEAKRTARATARASTPSGEAPPKDKAVRATGPGKPLLPSRNKKRREISASDAATATAWWVKK